jgi:DNA-binding IclR family transcriptional regulator
MARPRRLPPSSYQVRALHRGLLILTLFSPARPKLDLAEVSERLGIPKPTALRLLECLRDEGFLTWDQPTGLYSLGLRAFEVGSVYLATLPIEQVAVPFLRRLSEETNLTANLGVLDRFEVVHIAIVEPERPLRYHTRVGTRDRLHSTGLGKVLLAQFDEEALDELVRAVGLPAHTPATITDRATLDAELAAVRRLGYAEDQEETIAGLRCLAAPVRAANNAVVAAVSISGPAADFTRDARHGLLTALRRGASAISAQLGWSASAGKPVATRLSARTRLRASR